MSQAFAARVDGLSRRDGRLWLERAGRDEPVAVTVHYLRPLTSRTEIVFLDSDRKEVLSAGSIEAVAPAARPLVEEALRERYYLTTIERIVRMYVRFGTRYCEAETDRGPRSFALREPGKNVTWVSADRLVLRDTAGNRFEIVSLEGLDPRSRRLVRLSL